MKQCSRPLPPILLSGKWSGIGLFTSPNPARVLGGKNIIGKQLAITMSEEAGKRLNRNHIERADARIYYARDS
jgi:hypothetical protein